MIREKGGVSLLELSLHILDLLENAVRAGASVVCVTLREAPEEDLLEISVEDNGPGLTTSPEHTLDPFYTTKEGKRTGLGLSLFRAAAEQVGGRFTLERSAELGGVAARATMQLRHVDRAPLGDLPGTFFAMILTHPEVEFRCRVQSPVSNLFITTSEIATELNADTPADFAVAKCFCDKLADTLRTLSA